MPPMLKSGASTRSGRLGLARVAPGEVVEDMLRLLVGDRGSEAIAHLLDFLLPAGAVEDRRVALYVIDAVTHGAARRGEVTPVAVAQMDRVLVRECGRADERERREQGRTREGASHPPSSVTVCTMLS